MLLAIACKSHRLRDLLEQSLRELQRKQVHAELELHLRGNVSCGYVPAAQSEPCSR